MRSWFFTLFLLVAPLGPAGLAATEIEGQPERELVLLNWSDFIDPKVVSAFEAEHGVTVRVLYFENDEDRDHTLVQSDGRGADLVMVDGTTLGGYVARGWLAPLDEASMPNLRHLRESIRDVRPRARIWGTYGIAYRSELVPEPITAWKHLLEPVEALKGKLSMIDDSREFLTPAVKVLGHSANATEPAVLAEAARLLRAQRPFVKTYAVLSMDEESALVQGAIWAAAVYSGDALAMREHNRRNYRRLSVPCGSRPRRC